MDMFNYFICRECGKPSDDGDVIHGICAWCVLGEAPASATDEPDEEPETT